MVNLDLFLPGTFITDWRQAISGMGWFVAGLPIYLVMKKAVRK